MEERERRVKTSPWTYTRPWKRGGLTQTLVPAQAHGKERKSATPSDLHKSMEKIGKGKQKPVGKRGGRGCTIPWTYISSWKRELATDLDVREPILKRERGGLALLHGHTRARGKES